VELLGFLIGVEEGFKGVTGGNALQLLRPFYFLVQVNLARSLGLRFKP
jgi:hypothetical protein